MNLRKFFLPSIISVLLFFSGIYSAQAASVGSEPNVYGTLNFKVGEEIFQLRAVGFDREHIDLQVFQYCQDIHPLAMILPMWKQIVNSKSQFSLNDDKITVTYLKIWMLELLESDQDNLFRYWDEVDHPQRCFEAQEPRGLTFTLQREPMSSDGDFGLFHLGDEMVTLLFTFTG